MWLSISLQQCLEVVKTIGGANVKHYKILLLFLILAILPHGYGVDVITGSGYTSGYGEGYWTEYSFINYCPLCHHYNTLETYVKGVNEITCTHCDADYSYSGRDKHEGYSRAWLTPYVEPTPEPTCSKMEQVQPAPTILEIAQTVYKSNKIL